MAQHATGVRTLRTAAFVASLSLLATPASAQRDDDVPDLDWLWTIVHEQFYDAELAQRFFPESRRAELVARTSAIQSPDEFAVLANTLLDSFQVSHTGLYTTSDVEYWLFHGMFKSRNIEEPRVHHAGMQGEERNGHWVVRAVWDGLPAMQAGLRRGDVVLAADGGDFHPLRAFAPGQTVTLAIARGSDTLAVQVTPEYASINAALLQATRNSARFVSERNPRIAYVHLWSGTRPEIVQEFTRIVIEDFRNADGLILDLRDGWDGAWHSSLDPFFADRRDFFAATVVRRGQRNVYPAEPAGPHAWFAGPMVVLINEGTRSGKEAMAYQFKKSRRAALVGTTTAGAFAGGANYFKTDRFALFLPYNGPVLLDGQSIEGVGVTPDIQEAHALDENRNGDPQFERALAALREELTRR